MLIETVDYRGLRNLLSEKPALANEGISLCDGNSSKAHPLHRICDGVFNKRYTDKQAAEMAEIFLDFGSRVNGNEVVEKKDTPLIAASSLHADEVALLYIDRGADIYHAGTHGGTALHWAAWCGRDRVVARLLNENADINKRCTDFESTPLFWTIHGYKTAGRNNHQYIECARMLIKAGADKNVTNAEGTKLFDMLGESDRDMIALLA